MEIRKGRIKEYSGGIEYYLYKKEEENDYLKSAEVNSQPGENFSRKDQKRIEAENRQKRYKATKDIVKKIEETEKKIGELENREKELEKLLADPEIYGNPKSAREKTLEFNKTKEELELKLSEWEKLSEELRIIEQKFS